MLRIQKEGLDYVSWLLNEHFVATSINDIIEILQTHHGLLLLINHFAICQLRLYDALSIHKRPRLRVDDYDLLVNLVSAWVENKQGMFTWRTETRVDESRAIRRLLLFWIQRDFADGVRIV